MVKKLKYGYLKYCKRSFLGKKWVYRFCVLLEDSTFSWFKNENDIQPKGSVRLYTIAHLLPALRYNTKSPTMPPGGSIDNLLALGFNSDLKTHWFLADDEDIYGSWLSTIIDTLPPIHGSTSQIFITDYPNSENNNDSPLKRKKKWHSLSWFKSNRNSHIMDNNRAFTSHENFVIDWPPYFGSEEWTPKTLS